MHAGDDRGDGGRDEGAGGARGRLSGEQGELGERAARPPRPGAAGAGGGGRRRRARLLVGDAGRVAGDDAATRLVPQDGERAGQAAQAAATTGRSGALREIMYAPTKADAEKAIGAFVAEFEAKYPKATACLVEDQGGAAGLLCLSRGALAAPADVEPDRIAVRDGPAAPACDEGGRLPHQGAADGVQAAGDGAATVASAERGAPAASGASRSDVR